ncbi:MAG: hypothetical protein OXI12_01235 [Gammaproteobacteria bacterium]|nr:hypothetical protein [Gammaproteobacteria bacterium]
MRRLLATLALAAAVGMGCSGTPAESCPGTGDVEQCIENACPGWADCAASGRTDCSSLCDQAALDKCMGDDLGRSHCCTDCASAVCVSCCAFYGGCCGS